MRPRTAAARLETLLALLHRLEEAILVGLLLAMIVMAALQIVLRNLLGSTLVWGDVMVRISVLWIGLIGAMIASRKGEHIRIDIMSRLTPKHWQGIIDAGMQLVTAVICGIMAVHAFRFVLSEVRFGGVAFAGIPAWVCESIIPVAFSVITLRYLALAFRNFRTKPPTPAP